MHHSNRPAGSRRVLRGLAVPIAVAALALGAAACGDDDGSGASDSGDGPKVVATTGVAADIVEQVAGDGVEVVQLVPDGASPHSYSPSARDRQEIEEADLLVYFSPSLEEGLPLEGAASSFAIAEHVGELREGGEHDHDSHDDADEHADEEHSDDEHSEDEHADEEHADEEHADEEHADEEHSEDEHGDEEHADEEHADEEHADDEHAHEHEGGDPHVWLDPTRVAAALPELAAALAEVDPDGADDYDRGAREYQGELEELDAEIAALAEQVPPADRKLVTSHEVLGYFADRYGFEYVGAPFGLSPEAAASAATVAELIDAVEAEGVPAVFAQQGDDPKVLEQVADEAGVEVVSGLQIESLGPGAETYAEMMRATAGQITEALGG